MMLDLGLLDRDGLEVLRKLRAGRIAVPVPAQISRVDVTPLRGESLRSAIVAPAEGVRVTVEPELVERLVADAASEPGILPLLQETLVQLWDARTDQSLTLEHYAALGDGVRSGLGVALARRADAALQRFNTAQTVIARRVLLRLINFGEGRSDTRRQLPRARLLAAGDDAAEFAFVLQTLVDDRLLTVDDDVGRDSIEAAVMAPAKEDPLWRGDRPHRGLTNTRAAALWKRYSKDLPRLVAEAARYLGVCPDTGHRICKRRMKLHAGLARPPDGEAARRRTGPHSASRDPGSGAGETHTNRLN